MTPVLDIDDYRRVWMLVWEQCEPCGIEFECVAHENVLEAGGQCPECGKVTAEVVSVWHDFTDDAERFYLEEAVDIWRQLHNPDGEPPPDGDDGEPIPEINRSQRAA